MKRSPKLPGRESARWRHGSYPCLFLALMSAAVDVRAESRLYLPHEKVLEGSSGNVLDVLCEHDAPIVAYSVHIEYRPGDLRLTDFTTRGTDVERFDFFDARRDDAAGRIHVGCIVDQFLREDQALPPGPSTRLVRLVFETLAAEGTVTPVSFVVENDPERPPREAVERRPNAISVLAGGEAITEVVQRLENGSLTVTPRGLLVDAGDDRLVAESSAVRLDGSESRSLLGRQLVFLWEQIEGPPARDVSGERTSELRFTAPPVLGDARMLFRLSVGDGFDTVTDEVEVRVLDMELREASYGGLDLDTPRLLENGRRAVLFRGEVSWSSPLEDGNWTGIRFTARGSGSGFERVEAVGLYLDGNRDGEPDAGSEPLDRLTPTLSDGGIVELDFSHRLRDGDRAPFLLVVDLKDPVGTRSSHVGLWPLLALVVGGLAAGRSLRRDRPLRSGSAALLGLTLVGIVLALPIACSGGGGGGGGPAAPGSPSPPVDPGPGELRFDLVDPADVTLRGRTTGVEIPVTGSAQQGPTLIF